MDPDGVLPLVPDQMPLFDSSLPPLRMIDALFRDSPDVVLVNSRDGHFLYVGGMAAQALNRDAEQIVGKTPSEIGLSPELSQQLAHGSERVFTTGRPLFKEIILPSSHGVRSFEATFSPVSDEKGEPCAILCLGREVRPHRQARQEHRFLTALHDDNIQAVVHTKQAVETIETSPFPEGAVGEYFIYTFPLSSGADKPLVGSMSIDVSEMLQTQATLRLLETAFQQSHEAITITTAELDSPGPRILFVNPAFTRMTGYAPEEVIGRSPRILQGPETESRVLKRLRWNLSQGEPFCGETVNYRKDGSAFQMEWEISAMRNERGETTHFVATQRDVTERHADQQQLVRQFKRLTALHAVDVSINTNSNLMVTLGLLVEQVRLVMGVHAARILLLNRETLLLEHAAGSGFKAGPFASPFLAGQEPAVRARLERRLLTRADLSPDEITVLQAGHSAGESFEDYYAVPLIAVGGLMGVLELYHCEALRPAPPWLEFLETLAGQAASAINNAAYYADVVRDLKHANQELIRSHDTTIEGWSQALDLRDKETEGHSQRVTDLTLRLAKWMDVSLEEQMHMRRGALLHDIGKMGIPDNILLKPGPLTDAEWVIMRKHPEAAYELLHPIPFLRPALDIPLCHHEKWDGTGYPYGLKGEQIPLAARVFAVADVWDALCSTRPYREGWPMDRVREHIRAMAGSHFDPDVTEAFLQMEGGECG